MSQRRVRGRRTPRAGMSNNFNQLSILAGEYQVMRIFLSVAQTSGVLGMSCARSQRPPLHQSRADRNLLLHF
jgi:hypothetical protein